MPAEELAAVLDSPAVREAVTVVLERSDGGERELQWGDVSDALSREQWGRLVASGVVVGGPSGFRLQEPDRVTRYLSAGESETADDSAPELASWTRYDKLAGLVALVLVTGYWDTGVRNGIASLDDVVLGPVTTALPFYLVILLLAAATGVYSTALQARLRDTETVERYQERMERLGERRDAAEERGDEDALERIRDEQRDAASDQIAVLKAQFRPMVWVMLLTVPVFLWLRWEVRGGHLGASRGLVVPLAGAVSWQAPLLGPMPAWIVWYFVCSFVSRQFVRKGLGDRLAGS
ncbi:DUF106 domain-containing protein [Haloarcula onubensis]|uniref:DUF106 domain-containing protein n=1 Tax=Haloarcula onubensis TaxID=2950539 RepID=A0ABU2FR32_9EURY|nr:DUF106 domain-containing protein [Halomicroarcula sp. S3CR25-11]MDS0282697.1 DUF106 domain-containing protein [Halomicroarcula sp. S3CR25-11]